MKELSPVTTMVSLALRLYPYALSGEQPVAWKEYCEEYWLKAQQKSMYTCTGSPDITEILLKRP